MAVNVVALTSTVSNADGEDSQEDAKVAGLVVLLSAVAEVDRNG